MDRAPPAMAHPLCRAWLILPLPHTLPHPARREERVMDSNEFEKERGITISSKYTSFQVGLCWLVGLFC